MLDRRLTNDSTVSAPPRSTTGSETGPTQSTNLGLRLGTKEIKKTKETKEKHKKNTKAAARTQ
jgi:hypothetical protein